MGSGSKVQVEASSARFGGTRKQGTGGGKSRHPTGGGKFYQTQDEDASAPQQLLEQAHKFGILSGVGGYLLVRDKGKRGLRLQRASSGTDLARTELLLVEREYILSPITYGMMGSFYRN